MPYTPVAKPTDSTYTKVAKPTGSDSDYTKVSIPQHTATFDFAHFDVDVFDSYDSTYTKVVKPTD